MQYRVIESKQYTLEISTLYRDHRVKSTTEQSKGEMGRHERGGGHKLARTGITGKLHLNKDLKE